MKRAIIAHCWGGDPNYCWYPYVKKELEARGYEVQVPAFPDTENPNMDTWVPFLRETIGIPDEQLALIGHSIGCATIMRYLENLSEDEKVGVAILVAGFTDNLGFEEIGNFFKSPLNFEKIRSSVARGIVAIQSDNDPYVDLKYADILNEKLGAEIIIKHNAKHFSGATDGEETCLQLPDVVESVEKLIK